MKIITNRLQSTTNYVVLCKHVKREGGSCPKNNKCRYPDCVIEQLQKQVEELKDRLKSRHIIANADELKKISELKKYAQHTHDCKIHWNNLASATIPRKANAKCNCGLEQALNSK